MVCTSRKKIHHCNPTSAAPLLRPLKSTSGASRTSRTSSSVNARACIGTSCFNRFADALAGFWRRRIRPDDLPADSVFSVRNFLRLAASWQLLAPTGCFKVKSAVCPAYRSKSCSFTATDPMPGLHLQTLIINVLHLQGILQLT